MVTANEMGKRSWESRKSPEEIKRLKRISALGVAARKKKKDGR